MQKQRVWTFGKLSLLIAAVAGVVFGGQTALAMTLTSPNYQMTETQLGGGASTESCSDQYCARVSLGDMSGEKPMISPTARFEEISGSDPLLEVIIDAGESNLGVLTAETTATKTTIVRIRHYQSGGYQLQIVGTPPKFEDHVLAALATPTVSRPGTEQFGINIATNTAPVVGIDPVQVPAGETVFGIATDNYKTPNRFQYISGDVIARSTVESGRTDYTISMIVNISNSTPAGHYAGDFQALIVPAY